MNSPCADASLLAFTTIDSEDAARHLARQLLQERLVACVNVVPGVRSLYWWQGQLQESAEWLLLLKTTGQRWPQLKARLPELHPYEVPELIATGIADGLEPYLRWMVRETEQE
ncbi:divalent-cation tolerance protein CutA [Eleftheria terrae]|uniref:divalent-cation tolerance protein CutA n=1 Tax=Eleftheria terrae TaxID=1597781 RepID=UPI00263B294E|nr:divalent-cation tolerance protein CutA [Eleftheria terrae]WKB51615.1 divalent-cation tolerance protein CutA [Eleftheria terrae]